MSKPTQFNELGQFIAEGGLFGAALAGYRGGGDGSVAAFVGKHVSNISEAEYQSLFRTIAYGREAAEEMNRLEAAETIAAKMVPVVPGLFGYDAAGRRIGFIANVRSEDEHKSVDVIIETEDFLTQLEMEERVGEMVELWIELYPRLKEIMGKRKLRKMAIEWIFAARGF
jgi:hypothetical protein